MRLVVEISLVVIVGIGTCLGASRVLNASTDRNGNQHNQSTAVGGPASVTCTNTVGKDATCFIVGPGVGQQVPKGQNVGTSGAGTVTLSCNGTAPLQCQARVDGPVTGRLQKEVKKAASQK